MPKKKSKTSNKLSTVLVIGLLAVLIFANQGSVSGLLNTNGVNIVDSSGSKVLLKSVQIDWNSRTKQAGSTSIASSPEQSWFTLSDINRIKSAGGNAVEIHIMPLTRLMPSRNIVNTEYFTTWIDTWVNWCTDAELYCILDVTGIGARYDWEIGLTYPTWLYFGLGYPTPSTKAEYDAIMGDFFDLSVPLQDVNREAFTNLWRFIANRYKNNPYVMFSLMNEPFLGSTIHLNPSSYSSRLGQEYSNFMASIIDAIRAEGANQIIIVNHPWLHNPDWSLAVKPINRNNIIWEVHSYIGTYSFNDWVTNYLHGVDNYVNVYVNTFNKPLFFGEYGFNPMSTIRSTSNWMSVFSDMVNYLDSKQIAGRQWHQWGYLYGEYYGALGDYYGSLTQQESDWIVQTVLG